MTDAQRITDALRGRWHGHYGLCFCPAHPNTQTPALSISDGAEGRLLAKCHAGCAFPDIMDALRGLGLVNGGGTYAPPDPFEFARHMAEKKARIEKCSHQAARLWGEAWPIAGTVGEKYLRERGITCPLPASIRFHPTCWHPGGSLFPAMVAVVEGSEGFAVHRTYLRANGAGKADVEPAKAMLGKCAGGAVRLSHSAGPLVIAEGIETGLSLLCGQLTEPATVWAALSTSGIRGLCLPRQPGRLVIAPDGDAPGREAAHVLAAQADALGWDVSLLPAPDGRDWNDILLLKGMAA